MAQGGFVAGDVSEAPDGDLLCDETDNDFGASKTPPKRNVNMVPSRTTAAGSR